jgi:hypothetical protein
VYFTRNFYSYCLSYKVLGKDLSFAYFSVSLLVFYYVLGFAASILLYVFICCSIQMLYTPLTSLIYIFLQHYVCLSVSVIGITYLSPILVSLVSVAFVLSLTSPLLLPFTPVCTPVISLFSKDMNCYLITSGVSCSDTLMI